MSFTNQTKNTATYSNQTPSGASLTWDEATFTWDASDQANPNTWTNPKVPFSQQTKNTATYSNQTKNV